MANVDLNPLYRTLVGFDRLAGMIDQAARLDGASGYPPYNLEKTGDNTFRIELAVAGFSDADLSIELKDGTLHVAGRKPEPAAERAYLHRGIAERSFERRFQLADHVKVTGASLENGLLVVDLARELPESLKPRKVDIRVAGKSPTVIDAPQQAA
ncbi:MAG: Hsp20 family protein [Caulobacterales bacterium]